MGGTQAINISESEGPEVGQWDCLLRSWKHNSPGEGWGYGSNPQRWYLEFQKRVECVFTLNSKSISSRYRKLRQVVCL